MCGRQGSVKMISLVEISTGLLNGSQAGDRLMYFIQNKCVGFLDLIGCEKNQAIIVRYFGYRGWKIKKVTIWQFFRKWEDVQEALT